jgi:hypothetical protein
VFRLNRIAENGLKQSTNQLPFIFFTFVSQEDEIGAPFTIMEMKSIVGMILDPTISKPFAADDIFGVLSYLIGVDNEALSTPSLAKAMQGTLQNTIFCL